MDLPNKLPRSQTFCKILIPQNQSLEFCSSEPDESDLTGFILESKSTQSQIVSPRGVISTCFRSSNALQPIPSNHNFNTSRRNPNIHSDRDKRKRHATNNKNSDSNCDKRQRQATTTSDNSKRPRQATTRNSNTNMKHLKR